MAAKKTLPKAPPKPAPKKAPQKSEPAKKAVAKKEPPTKPTVTEKTPAKSAAAKVSTTVKRAAAKVVEVVAATAQKVLGADVGQKAPAFELNDESGKAVSSASLSGKPYLLYFYPKDDTPGCTKEACDIRDSFARFGKQGLRVLGVSPDTTQSHAKFIKKYGLPFTLLSDPDKALANAYGVWAEKSNYGKKYMGIVRSSFLIGADGTIKKAYRGVKVNGHVDAVLEDAQAVL
jgi:thioredoxin-dependent peroxiredoxin